MFMFYFLTVAISSPQKKIPSLSPRSQEPSAQPEPNI